MKDIKLGKLTGEMDLNRLIEIWLNSNIDAHNFIEENYWRSNIAYLREELPKSDLYLAEIDNKIVGFMGIMDSYIAGIFIDKDFRSMGLGKKLLQIGKDKYDFLSLNVYVKNENAYKFYLNNDFIVEEKTLDEANNQYEYYMTYKK